jgi:hypothetical protein
MIRRDFSRRSLRTFHFIAIVSFLAATGFPNGAWAQPSAATTTSTTANKTLNVFCRAADLPNTGLPAERLPAEQALSPTEAKRTLDVIKQLSKTKSPLCSQNVAAPNSVLKTIDKIGRGVSPVRPGGPLPARVFHQTLDNVRGVFGQVKANE